MAVVIAYQSLNSNSSSNHGVSASNSQPYTGMAHNHSAQDSQPWALIMPTADSEDPHVPIHGPAQLVSTAPSGFMNKGQHSNAKFLSMVEGKARQLHQHLIRAFPRPCDLLVFGELDSNHVDWSSMQKNAGKLVHSSTPSKTCNCFSVHSTGVLSNKIAEGTGWIAVSCANVVTVFVHVPNSIATQKDKLTVFYQNINNAVLGTGCGSIDLIMGDTNQAASGVTPEIVSKALNTAFGDAHQGKSIAPVDSYQREFGGTNATATKKYDVAVFNKKTIKKIEATYLSQFSPVGSSVAAVTDHMGICVYVEK